MNEKNVMRGANIYMTVLLFVWTALYITSVLMGYQKDSLAIFVIWHSVITKGWKRTLVIFCIAVLVPFVFEVLGVNFGYIFGPYDYTEMLGFKLLGVPVVIVLAWEPILYSSFYIVEILTSSSEEKESAFKNRMSFYLGASFVAALVTTSWDLMMDPIAVNQGWWVWEQGGPYVPYIGGGVPMSNYIGWMGVAFTCSFFHRWIMSKGQKVSSSDPAILYGPYAVYVFLFFAAFLISITMHHHAEFALAGLMGMGGFVFMAGVKLNAMYPIWDIPSLIKKISGAGN